MDDRRMIGDTVLDRTVDNSIKSQKLNQISKTQSYLEGKKDVQRFRNSIQPGLRSDRPRKGSVYGVFVVGVLIVGLIASCFIFFLGNTEDSENIEAVASVIQSSHSTTNNRLFPIEIRTPAGPPKCYTGLTDGNGQPVTVSCSTCHSTRRPNDENKVVEDLNEFHGSLKFAHGALSCLSCHNSEDYDALKLADGSRVEFSDVMTLCAQCHGQQKKDYDHGAHGGMSGFWDQSRGPRIKNNCVDCHAPHWPQFPKMQPTFKPRDRFLEKESH